MSDNASSYIVDTPLPLALDFQQLKAAAIAQLQQLVGTVWTNFNDSDPGVTILEQLCYALTELGYCAQMPIEDVLTRSDGSIDYDGQFFAAQDILTTAPVTVDDYRKLIYDRVAQVRAVYVQPQSWPVSASSTQRATNARYEVHVAFHREDLTQAESHDLLNTIDYLLHQHRNLGEFFYFPTLLSPQHIRLKGKVYLSATAQLSQVVEKLTQALRQYAAPQPQHSGYSELQTAGLNSEQIMNGPRLQNGWISAPSALADKCSSVSCGQIANLLSLIDGVSAIESLSFVGNQTGNTISIAADALPQIEFLDDLKFMQNKQVLPATPVQVATVASARAGFVAQLQAAHMAAGVEARVDVYPPRPVGKYRDIEAYYSIQNTFPDMYAIGANSLESDAPDYRVASARQLKAYLLVYDQLLANEFSQLAHVGDLFSFAPPPTKLPPPTKPKPPVLEGTFYDHYFSTTYFCQDLYAVPDIKPLLLGNQSFHYQFDLSLPPKQVADLAWQRYQQFPFNEYMHGLRQCMEDRDTANQRRDQLLTHVMARHGDEAQVYEVMMSAFQSYGTALETRIIIKSIWMQNFQWLSYNRMKACNWRSATQLLMPGDTRLTPEQNWLPMPPIPSIPLPAAVASTPADKPLPWWRREAYPTKDGELDQERLFSATRLAKNAQSDALRDYADVEGEQDQERLFSATRLAQNAQSDALQDYAGVEHKLDILLGLPTYLLHLSGKLYGLLADSQFTDWLKQDAPASSFYSVDMDVTLLRISAQEDRLFHGELSMAQLQNNTSDVMQIVHAAADQVDAASRRLSYEQHADQLLWLARQRKAGILLEHQLLFVGETPEQVASALPASLGQYRSWQDVLLAASLVLPGYVSIVAGQDLANYLDSLKDLHWPCYLDLQLKKLSFDSLDHLISHYVSWHNASEAKQKDEAAQQLLISLGLNADTGVRA